MNRHPVQQIQNNNNNNNSNSNNVPLKSLRFISTIMSLLLIISIACSLLVRLRAMENRPRLEISSINPRELMNFTFNQHTTWILTCKVIPSDRFPPFNITLRNERANRLAHSNSSNSITLSIINATDADSGEYKCTAQGSGLRLTARAVVRVIKATPCTGNSFSCGGTCIFPVYLCDGYQDCPDGSDEDPEIANCTYPVCLHKLWCGKRCIPPHWCCTPGQEGCSVQHVLPCCHNAEFNDVSELRRRDDGFLETTIYVVIGCTTAFLVLLIVLVVAICRFHMKRTPVSRHPRTPMNITGRIGMARPPGAPGIGDFDIYLNQALLDLSQHSGLLVTYNINSGVQLVGRPIDPPPYCEVVSAPPRGGPPPPYVPRENMRLQAEDSEDAVNSEDDALLRGVDYGHPIGGTDCPPPGPTAHQAYSRRPSEDSLPCRSDEVPVPDITSRITLLPALKGKPPDSAPSPGVGVGVGVVADEAPLKQICATSPSLGGKDSAG